LPAPLGAVVALGTLAFLTGSIHLDGFLDGCDAFFASVSAERRREILKDPRHGTFAVVAFAFVASAAGIALATLPPRAYPELLAFLCAAGRLGGVIGAFVFPNAGAPEAGSHFPRSRATTFVTFGTFVATTAAGFAIAPPLAVLVPALVLAGLAIEFWICSRVGGMTGDGYGFAIVAIETLGIVAVAGALSHRS
jgi:adenosylcobinamide-GDP ribazoletransferase